MAIDEAVGKRALTRRRLKLCECGHPAGVFHPGMCDEYIR
jgi:hypothetical protein